MINPILLPCPFCGGEAHVYRFDRKLWHAECNDLFEDDEKDRCNGLACAWGESKAQAIEKWNTRYHIPPPIRTAPGIKEPMQAIPAKEGESVTLECEPSCKPQPTK
jgi:hypothetical protein